MIHKKVCDLRFDQAVMAVNGGFTWRPTFWRPRLEQFLKENHVQRQDCLVIGTGAAGNRHRFELVEGINQKDLLRFAPQVLGGWYILRENEIQSVTFTSAEPGVHLVLERCLNLWSVMLLLANSTKGYQPFYSQIFHSALDTIRQTMQLTTTPESRIAA